MKGKNSKMALQQSIVEGIKNSKLEGLSKPKSAIGNFFRNRKIAKFEKTKLNALKDISRRQQGVVAKGIDAAKEIGATFIGTETAKELSRDSYKNSLAAWTRNISGNPDTKTGSDGETQQGSTSELGG